MWNWSGAESGLRGLLCGHGGKQLRGKAAPRKEQVWGAQGIGTSTATANKTEEREGAIAVGHQSTLRPGTFLFLLRNSHKYKKYKNML